MDSILKRFVNRLKNMSIFVWNMRAYHLRKDDLTHDLRVLKCKQTTYL